ncbi:MAG: sugar phosphate isomerase/epimerase [Verrucomicrobia bacterium]|nr:sugar phosphate isomerase/epimerase [Verrucomicrobiota bacterium]
MKTILLCLTVLTINAFAGSFRGMPGLQLYSLREDFKNDVPGTLKKVKEYGFREVELAGTYGLSPEEFKKLLAANGLVAIAGHFPYDQYRKDPEAVARDAKALGLKYAGCAWAGHKPPLDEKQCRDIAEVFNKAGAALAKHGIKFFYHNHGFEFVPHGNGTLFDLLMELTDPKTVFYQMDVLWTVFPGQDPVKLLEKYGSRWQLLHLKDLKKGVPTGSLSGKTDKTNDVPLGTGQVDYPAVLRAAQKIGVKYYFIEDESPTVHEQLPQSLKFLREVKW